MKNYDKYKDSGIEWIGEIPEHWKVKKIKDVTYDLIGGGTPKTSNEKFWSDSDGTPWVAISDITASEHILSTEKKVTEEGINNKNLIILKKGTLLYSIFASVGKTAILGVNATTNQAILGIIPDDTIMQRDFLKYFLQDFKRNILSLSSPNTQENLNLTKVKNLKIPKPPINEQKIIVNFLDNKTQKFDSIIENKKKQIDLLKENKLITITNTVHLGLNSHKIRDSNNRWLGKISSNWDTKKLKEITSIKFSNVDKKTNEDEKSVLLCNYVDVYKNEFIKNNMNLMKATAKNSEIEKFTIKEGDVIVTKDSETPDDIAVPAYVYEEIKNVLCGYHLALIRSKNNIIGKFLFRVFESDKFNAQFEYAANGITRHGLSTHAFNNALIPIPSKEEQLEIIEFVDDYSKNISNSIKTIQQQISKFEEYKKILINGAITGKIKVSA